MENMYELVEPTTKEITEKNIEDMEILIECWDERKEAIYPKVAKITKYIFDQYVAEGFTRLEALELIKTSFNLR